MLIQSQTRKASILPLKQSVLWDAPSSGVDILSLSCCLEVFCLPQFETEGKEAILIYFLSFGR